MGRPARLDRPRSHLGELHGLALAPLLFSILAVVELVTDQLPTTPSRKTPVPFGGRIVSGAFCGAALGAAAGATLLGLVLGVVGAVAGTLGGAELRARLAASYGVDRPAALIEDARRHRARARRRRPRMTPEPFDDIVIGGGQAGPSLAVRLAGAGRRVALVERRHLGGTCINTGCRPTKTLIASAKVAAMARRAADYGIADRAGDGRHPRGAWRGSRPSSPRAARARRTGSAATEAAHGDRAATPG